MATNLIPPGPPVMTSAQLTQFLHMLPWLALGAPVFIALFLLLARRLAQQPEPGAPDSPVPGPPESADTMPA